VLIDWWRSTSEVRRETRSTIDRAIALGERSDRLGLAFFGGYTAAIASLDPTMGPDEVGALCATETGGGHPRAIRTAFSDGRVEGEKLFVSGGALATKLLVVTKIGEEAGRPKLVVVRVAAAAPGVSFEELPALGFVPEVPHAAVKFNAASVEQVLEGDGYERYLKPFRTIEDVHVFAAVVSCLCANGAALPQQTLERLFSVLASLRQLAMQDPSAARTHLALAGTLSFARAEIDALELTSFDPGFGERLDRDRPLLRIAEKVREQRRLKAWERRSSNVTRIAGS
jgi:alkylation response protein AidB-like acyl-CoA dehydrogenase